MKRYQEQEGRGSHIHLGVSGDYLRGILICLPCPLHYFLNPLFKGKEKCKCERFLKKDSVLEAVEYPTV